MEQKSSLNNSEKKWHLFVVEESEGPFTVPEIKERIKYGEARETSYVWAPGLQDWTVLSSLPDFGYSSVSTGVPNMPNSAKSVPKNSSTAADALGFNRKVSGESHSPSRAPKQGMSFSFGGFFKKIFLLLIFTTALYQATATDMLEPLWKTVGLDQKISSMHLPILPFSDLIDPVITPIRPQLMKLRKKTAAMLPQNLRKFILPINLPNETNEKDRDVLIEAALSPVERGGRLASSFIAGTEENPRFAITSNLPDGTRFDIHLHGKPGTLLGATNFVATTTATLKEKVAITEPFTFNPQQKLPAGEYLVRIYDSDEQSPELSIALAAIPKKAVPEFIPEGRTAFTLENMFLGGAKDDMYVSALKKYNEMISEQKKAELEEITQYQTTIESLANESASRFFAITSKKIILKKQKSEWSQYSRNYKKISEQIQLQLNPNGVASAQNSRIYPELYEATKIAFQASEELHYLESIYFDRGSTMAQIQEKASAALELITKLKSQISETLKTY